MNIHEARARDEKRIYENQDKGTALRMTRKCVSLCAGSWSEVQDGSGCGYTTNPPFVEERVSGGSTKTWLNTGGFLAEYRDLIRPSSDFQNTGDQPPNENERIKKGHDNDDEDGNDNDDEDYNINEDNDDDDNDDNGPGRSSVAGSRSPAAKPEIPAIPMHLTGQQLQTFNELSSILELNEDYKVKGRELCNVHEKSDHFTAMMVNLLASQKKLDDYHEFVTSKITQLLESLSSVSGPMKGWNPAHKLRQTVRMIATQCIITGDVQAYMATRDKQGNQEHLPLSLSANVLDKILENPSEWRKRLLPAQYGRNPDPVESKDFHKWLNVILKEIRKDLNKILLTNIHIPNRAEKTPSLLNVPTIESIIMKTHSSNINRSMKENTTLSEAKARYAWLYYHNHSFWGVVDDKLEDLRTKSVRYRYATFTEIKGTTDFALPSEDEVQAQIKHLDQTHGAVIEQPEASHQEPE
ncbi:uncharacterized protein MELLADRAFT_90519 [Melampsora larici-populina 98AG31]|uniref:Uncharacterized protein n=1 Tax=Melampsora larici-populina (strain 98AG31 / pathotype 3-4-7) TaxID=747676 RepID=F4RX69_MELLP|nr:uncharacterized protein MELLADRAFT_90519 [Melampsora larici-populina 98AG31]EGG02915.1 hypothetical protein MELLADRAFT_90519 [Melampsora larici-populina 98AG31]